MGEDRDPAAVEDRPDGLLRRDIVRGGLEPVEIFRDRPGDGGRAAPLDEKDRDMGLAGIVEGFQFPNLLFGEDDPELLFQVGGALLYLPASGSYP